MKYLYFGQDADCRYFADDEAGARHYMPRSDWLGILNGANVPVPSTNRVRLQVKEQVSVEVYEGDELKRTVVLTPDITEI